MHDHSKLDRVCLCCHFFHNLTTSSHQRLPYIFDLTALPNDPSQWILLTDLDIISHEFALVYLVRQLICGSKFFGSNCCTERNDMYWSHTNCFSIQGVLSVRRQDFQTCLPPTSTVSYVRLHGQKNIRGAALRNWKFMQLLAFSAGFWITRVWWAIKGLTK